MIRQRSFTLLMRLFLPAVSCLLFTGFLLPSVVYGQAATATLSGTVLDQNGAVVAGASITLVNNGTTLQRQSTTNEQGSFTIPLLPPGPYTLNAQRDGFSPVRVENLVLNVGDQKAVQIQLKAGDVNATVTVDSSPEAVRTDGSVGTVVDRQFVANLPLNGRSFQSLILLTPGVVVTPATSASPGQFSVNGQRSNANYYTVDGVSANTGAFNAVSGFASAQALAGVVPGLTTFGGTNGLVSIDALEEFKIQTSTYSAEFGRQPGGQISLVTRSGKNQFHGGLFDYLRNDVFDANDWFANAARREKAPLRQNQFGGTFSGPVMLPSFGEGGRQLGYNGRNRTFFFFSYEGLRLRLPQTVVRNVPSLRLREVAAAVVRPILNAFPLPDGPELLNASGQPLGFSPFTGVYSEPSALNATSIRIDHAVNEKLTLFGRFNNAPSNTATRRLNGLSQVTENDITARSLTLGATLAVTSSLSNELRFSITRDRVGSISKLDSFGGAVPTDRSTSIPNTVSEGARVNWVISLSGLNGQMLLGPGLAFNQQQMNLVDNMSWVKGGHQFKFGIDYRRLAPIYSPVDQDYMISFRTEALIRSGTADRVNIDSGQGSRPLFTNISIYGQDRWKLSTSLTLDLGLRWEINPAPGEADGKKPVLVIGADNLPTATLAPPDAPIYRPDYRAFAPRVGVAYRLSDTKGWERVVRGGFGVYYDVGSGLAAIGFTGFPFFSSTSLTNVPIPIPPALAAPPPFQVVSKLPITSFVVAFDPNLKLPYTLQWNVSVEQSLGVNQTVSASYVAAAARRLLTFQSVNDLTSGQRPSPNFGDISVISNGPTSNYQSLQLQFQRRLTKGFQALISYTWSHAIDEVSDEVTQAVLERGNASFDLRHNLSSAVTYNLPGRGLGGVLGRVIGGWSVDGILHAQSALPVDIFANFLSVRDERGNFLRIRPDRVAGEPLYITDPSVAGGRRFNSAAFKAPPVGPNGLPARQGTFGRNVLRGLPLYQVDAALRRQLNLTEKVNVQLKAECFNLFNHPNFGGFGTTFTVPATFGVPSQLLGRSLGGLSPLYQIGGPRSLQFSLRLTF